MEKYNDEIQLKDILIKLSEYKAFLLTKKFAVIFSSFLFCVMGFLYASFSEKTYNADLTFIVESESGGSALGSMSGIASQFGFDLGGGSEGATFSQANIIELLKSRGVIVNALMQSAKVNSKTDLLVSHYLEINKEMLTNSESLQEISFHAKGSYIHDSISGVIWLAIIDNNLTIEVRSDEANIITLSYTSLNEEFAKVFVEMLINEMSRMYILHQTAHANNTLDFLKNRADSVFSELKIAEQKFARVKDINQRIVKASGRLRELQLMRSVEVLNTMYLELIKNLEISKITLLNKTPIINIIDKPILPLVVKEISIKFAVLLGGILGTLLSLFYFIIRKLVDDAIK